MRHILVVISMVAFLQPVLNGVQKPTQDTPLAKAEFEKGEAARKKGDFNAASGYYRRAIELNPDDTDAHEMYIFVRQQVATSSTRGAVLSGKASAQELAEFKNQRRELNAEISAEYQKLAAAHSDKAGYEWALGFLNDHENPETAITYYQAALKIDPKFAPAYQSLAVLDEGRGDLEGSREALRKAVETNPADPASLLSYASAFHYFDPPEFTRLSLEVVKQFPESKQAALALYWLATTAPTDTAKLQYLLMLRADHAPAALDWKGNGMPMLFNIYLRTEYAKAIDLAQEMLKAHTNDPFWSSVLTFAQSMRDADHLIHDGKAEQAVAALDKVSLPSWYHTEDLLLMRGRALQSDGKTESAYDALFKEYASNPTDEVYAPLIQYGQMLGKTVQEVDKDVWSQRVRNSRPAVPFSLPNYTNNQNVSLDDLRGHVVLLNFWYPLCGPCHQEFPYIQAVLNKYKDQGFEIVAINVAPPEDNFVVPLLRGFKLGFLPLKGNDQWAAEAYKVRGEPTNFLIGADGRVYFDRIRPVSDRENQRTLELQIEALLQHTKG